MLLFVGVIDQPVTVVRLVLGLIGDRVLVWPRAAGCC